MSSVIISGDTSGAITVSAPAVAGTNTLTLQAATATSAVNTRATAVASTSGTAIDFTALPSWIKRITVMFNETSLSNTDNLLIQLGTGSTTYTTSGYVSTSNAYSNASATSGISSTTGFAVTVASSAANIASGTLTLINISGNTWVSSHTHKIGTTTVGSGGGSVTLGAVLTAVRITSTGTATFDAGTINILYEG